jgi:hypothetical protein
MIKKMLRPVYTAEILLSGDMKILPLDRIVYVHRTAEALGVGLNFLRF